MQSITFHMHFLIFFQKYDLYLDKSWNSLPIQVTCAAIQIIVSILGREEGYTVKYTPWPESKGIYLTIIKLVIPPLIYWQLVCILPRECTVKYTPCLEVVLQELNLRIPSFRSMYCIRIRTRGGIYGQIYPLPEGVPEGEVRGNSWINITWLSLLNHFNNH